MDQFADLLEKEMDRGEFLKAVGLGVMALVGSNFIIRALFNPKHKQAAPRSVHPNETFGYGASVYGGGKR